MPTKKTEKPITPKWLRDWRTRLGWTQEQAAKALGFAHRNSFDKLERGERKIPKSIELACRWLEATA